MSERRITPVILSGGSGTRLWPLSREEKPKQLLALTGIETMLQMTARRVADASMFDAPVVVASDRHADQIEAQLDEIGIRPSRLILEPCPRNTAPAIALAALTGEGDELLLVMPSDHLIVDVQAFQAAVRAARPLVEDGWLVTFGIRPSRAETGYGYIRRGAKLRPGAFQAEAFVEKPDSATAASYLASGRYDWNGGIFLFRANTFLDALTRYDPDIRIAVDAAVVAGRGEGRRMRPEEASFMAAPSRSIDHAIMEKADRIAVVPVDMGWSDVGSWDQLYELGGPDEAGNVLDAGAVAIDSQGCLIRSEGPKVSVIGISDLIVVATAEAVLIVPRGESQRVKEAVDALKRSAVADGTSL